MAEMPEWLSAAEDLLQASTAGEAAPATVMCEVAGEAAERGRAAARLQRAWRRREESAAKDRVQDFFAKARAEEAWRRALAEFEERVARAAAQEAAEADRWAEEAARTQRKAEAKARLEVREAEDRIKRKVREERAAARKAAVQAAQAPPLLSLPSMPEGVLPSQPANLPTGRLFPSPGPPQTSPSQTAEPSPSTPLRLPPSQQADPPSPKSFLPSWGRAHKAACTLQRAWRRRLRQEEAALEASRAAVLASDKEVAHRLAVLEAEKAAMEDHAARNIATVRAFRKLEAKLREQGVRIAHGVGTGGRQRRRLRERQRAECIAEDLLKRELAIW